MSQDNIRKILDELPHRFPILMVDRILDFDEDSSTITTLKNISMNEPVFTGHFPEVPIFPGVFILEFLAQSSGLLSVKIPKCTMKKDCFYLFAGIDNARFKKPVVPGDQLIGKLTLVNQKRNIFKFKGEAFVDDELVASADIICAETKL